MVLSFSSNIQKMAGGVWTNSIQPENYNIILKIPPRAAYFFVETDFFCALTIFNNFKSYLAQSVPTNGTLDIRKKI